MPQNYRFLISYDGSRYYGWEHQPDTEMTIQGKLEAVLARMLDAEGTELIGAGRTDAGVHALGMVANAVFETTLSPKEIKEYFNRYLPEDICVLEVAKAGDRFHSRYNAIGKTYRYTCYIGEDKPVFDRKFVYVPEKKPDVQRMREAARYLTGEHDYASFCAHAGKKKSTVRRVDLIEIEEKNGYLTFLYHGSGFLQYMVRILTGTLLEVGFGDREPESMRELLDAKDRTKAGFTAPAKGLCMMKVDYD
ncbi:MAG: tRNA pseudouridine(38-40) synthase TruA [Lachnospiraceae bacterium]|nr:tRNA pseudouridine(38-40) synthase TruA [Lachnospiraceae bacterium]